MDPSTAGHMILVLLSTPGRPSNPQNVCVSHTCPPHVPPPHRGVRLGGTYGSTARRRSTCASGTAGLRCRWCRCGLGGDTRVPASGCRAPLGSGCPVHRRGTCTGSTGTSWTTPRPLRATRGRNNSAPNFGSCPALLTFVSYLDSGRWSYRFVTAAAVRDTAVHRAWRWGCCTSCLRPEGPPHR